MQREAKRRRDLAGRLGAYLAAGVGVGTLGTTAEAGIITIDVSGFNGINGGVPSGSYAYVELTPGGGDLEIMNGAYGIIGLDGDVGLYFAYDGGYVSPTKLSAGMTVDSSLFFTDYDAYSAFRITYDSTTYASPDFGPGSYMGFVDGLGRFGYLEVTWNSSLDQFQILSGAYEDVSGVGIVIPNAAVPEPSTLGLMALGAAGLLAARARKVKAEPAVH